jgi:hypothetical protein
MNPQIFREKLDIAFVWFANAVASEAPETANHVKRLKIARQLLAEPCPFDKFILVDMVAQGYTWETAQETFQDRLSALATNLVNLGFGD